MNIETWKQLRKQRADGLDALSAIVTSVVMPAIQAIASEIGDDPFTDGPILTPQMQEKSAHVVVGEALILGNAIAIFEPATATDGTYLRLYGLGIERSRQGPVEIKPAENHDPLSSIVTFSEPSANPNRIAMRTLLLEAVQKALTSA